MRLLLLLAALLPVQEAQVRLDTRIVRAAPAAGDDVAGYVRIVNRSGPDRLVEVSCTCAARVEVHRVDRSGPTPSMVTVEGLEVPAQGFVEIRPGSPLHLMLMGAKAPMAAGSKVELSFRFEHAGTITASFDVVEDSRAAWEARSN